MSERITLKVGGRYISRSGREFEVTGEDFTRPAVSDSRFDGEPLDNPGAKYSWNIYGVFEIGFESEYDLVSEAAPAYRYFCYAADDRDDLFFVVWRFREGSALVEGRCPNLETDEWSDAELDFTVDILADPLIVECDSSGAPLEQEAPTYRYFADHCEMFDLRTVWRVSEDGKTEARHYGKAGDPWEVCLCTDPIDFEHEAFFECDADRNPLPPPEPYAVSFATTLDLTPESRTRVAKLAARIVLADGPVLTVDELAGMTVGELVTTLGDNTIYSV